MVLLFWSCLAVVVYTYLGYPILLFIMVKIKRLFNPQKLDFYNREDLPAVDLVIACFNEADILEEKIKNTLALDYPEDKLTINFVTDGSTDHSGSILSKYPKINHLHSDGRKGKKCGY